MLVSWLAPWKSRKSDTKPRLEFERLETREVPAGIAVWTGYVPRVGDRVDALIRQLAPAVRDDITFFKNLNGWLSTSIAPRVPAWTNVNVYLAQLAGDCTVRAHIFQAVAQRLGYQVQIVVFSGVPYQGMHMAIEVALRGSWKFFDPTSGIYLAARSNPRIPLGLPQARSIFRRVVIMDSTAPLFRGVWSSQRLFTYTVAVTNLVRYQGRPAFNLSYTYFVAPMVQQGPTPLP